MNTVENREESSRLLLRFLSEEVIRKEVPAELWQQMEQQFGANVYQEILYILTQMTFDRSEAREHWEAILEHRQALFRLPGPGPGAEGGAGRLLHQRSATGA